MPEYEGVSYTCWNCHERVSSVPIARDSGMVRVLHGQRNYPPIALLRCPNPDCEEGSVVTKNGVVMPRPPAGGLVRNLPPDVEQAWREARLAFGAGAFTAAEMMCRKILMHIAVDRADAKPGLRWIEYVDLLRDGGYFSPGVRHRITEIKDRGNDANHQLPASTETDAEVTMALTRHLLASEYELSGAGASPFDPAPNSDE